MLEDTLADIYERLLASRKIKSPEPVVDGLSDAAESCTSHDRNVADSTPVKGDTKCQKD